MKQETLQKYVNKRVRIFLSNGKVYTGKILSVDDDACRLFDKFQQDVMISNAAILQIECEDNGGDVDGRRQ